MKQVFCSECGTRLQVIRKAMPRYGTILDLVNPHECSPEPVELDFKPTTYTPFILKAKGKFAENLEKLEPTKFPIAEDAGLRDRREEKDVRSTAPQTILDHV